MRKIDNIWFLNKTIFYYICIGFGSETRWTTLRMTLVVRFIFIQLFIFTRSRNQYIFFYLKHLVRRLQILLEATRNLWRWTAGSDTDIHPSSISWYLLTISERFRPAIYRDVFKLRKWIILSDRMMFGWMCVFFCFFMKNDWCFIVNKRMFIYFCCRMCVRRYMKKRWKKGKLK